MMKIHGDSCTTYTSSNSQLPGNSVTDLSIDANGHLWIADMEGGLIEFDRESSWTIYNSENGIMTLSVGNLSKGIYMMKVSSNGSTVCKKLMVK